MTFKSQMMAQICNSYWYHYISHYQLWSVSMAKNAAQSGALMSMVYLSASLYLHPEINEWRLAPVVRWGMKKLFPLFTLSLLLVGCESRVDKLKIACSNVELFSDQSEYRAKFEKEIIQLAELPADDDLYSKYPVIFCNNLEEFWTWFDSRKSCQSST